MRFLLYRVLCFIFLFTLAVGVDEDYFYDNYDDVLLKPLNRTFLPSPYASSNDPNVVALPYGRGLLLGKELRSAWTGRSFKAFLGIKYGAVGPGLGRFQKAKIPPVAIGITDTTAEPPPCPSFTDMSRIEHAEKLGANVDDCLTLSVFTPNVFGTFPVMVYVHGEMLFDGSAEEAKPEYLLERSVVLVSVNYRLAPFGFLSTATDDIPGNIALSDLEMALQWVQDNIVALGGNPNNVTLFGQAGGATLVHALSISGKVEPKNFQRLILQSGTALNPLFIDEDAVSTARAIAREARCPYTRIPSLYDLNRCFGQLNTSQLLLAFLDHCKHNENRGIYSYGGFKLIVGDKLGYIPAHPALMVKSFKYPMIAGLTKDAGAFILIRKYDELYYLNSRNITDYINVVLKYTTTPKYYSMWRNWALEYIFTPLDIRMPVLNNLASGLLELTNLILYKAPILESMKTSWHNNATFLYSFDYRGRQHRFPRKRTRFPYEIDANLSDDNMYLFPYPEEVSRLSRPDRQVALLMVDMWTNFAIKGKPEEQLWPQVKNDYGPFVRITNKLELDYHFGDGIPLPDLYGPLRTNSSNPSKTLS